MNNKKLLTIFICLVSGLHGTMVSMQDGSQINEIMARRNENNKKRASISKTCWAASSLFSIAAGGYAGWLTFQHKKQLLRLVQQHPYMSAIIGGTSIMLLNLGASWLTKHAGWYHFLTHHGNIQKLKHDLNILAAHEWNSRCSERKQVEDNLTRIANLKYEISQSNANIKQMNEELPAYRLQLATSKFDALLKSQNLTAQLRAEFELRKSEFILCQTVQPDPALNALSKKQIETQLIQEIDTAAHANMWADHWVRICQLVNTLYSIIKPADATHKREQEELSPECMRRLLLLVKFSREIKLGDMKLTLLRFLKQSVENKLILVMQNCAQKNNLQEQLPTIDQLLKSLIAVLRP